MTLGSAFRRLCARRRAQAGALLLSLVLLMAIFADALAGPGASLLDLDASSHDVFAHLVHGSRTALGLGAGVAIASLVLGGLIGAFAGMVGGLWDSIVLRWVEAAGVFPAVILIALLRAMENEPSWLSLFAVATLVRSAEMARLVRLLIIEGQATGFALAARALGASRARIVLRHILPNGLGTILVSAFFSMSVVVLLETSLSFLGLGVPTATASWGRMLGEIHSGTPLLAVIAPILALATTLGALALVGDALRDELDPRGEARGIME